MARAHAVMREADVRYAITAGFRRFGIGAFCFRSMARAQRESSCEPNRRSSRQRRASGKSFIRPSAALMLVWSVCSPVRAKSRARFRTVLNRFEWLNFTAPRFHDFARHTQGPQYRSQQRREESGPEERIRPVNPVDSVEKPPARLRQPRHVRSALPSRRTPMSLRRNRSITSSARSSSSSVGAMEPCRRPGG